MGYYQTRFSRKRIHYLLRPSRQTLRFLQTLLSEPVTFTML
jgi:hypothetical protein